MAPPVSSSRCGACTWWWHVAPAPARSLRPQRPPSLRVLSPGFAASGREQPPQPSRGFCVHTFDVTWKFNRFGIQYTKELLQFLFISHKVVSQAQLELEHPRVRLFPRGQTAPERRESHFQGVSSQVSPAPHSFLPLELLVLT